jgi:transposase
MFNFGRRIKIFVSKEPVDMRASYDTLFEKTKGISREDPFSGHLFVFINSKRTSIKCLYFDGTGLVLICKRLEKSTFSRINPYFSGEVVLTPAEFTLFFEGANLVKRFIDSPSEIKRSIKNRFPMSQELQAMNQ